MRGPVRPLKAIKLAKVKTDRTGSYSYTLPAGESRMVTVTYAGSKTVLGSSASLTQNVAGKVTARIAKAFRAGQKVELSGKVEGGYVPKAGVQIHIQYEIPGHIGWTTFQAMHTTKTGAFHIRFPVSKGAFNTKTGHGYRYEFRVVIPQQSGWPYGTATSNTLIRTATK